MKIQFASDLHLEMVANAAWLQSHPLEVVGDILVLAGDTAYLEEGIPNWFLDWASASYQQVLLIPGNHEYYHYGDIAKRGESWQWMLRENVGYYYNKVVTIGNTDFILSTMWSHIPEVDMFQVQRGLNDFYQILCNDNRLTPDDFNAEHERCKQFIMKSVAESKAKHIVVVTHHVPTLQAVAPQYQGSTLSSAFAVEMGNFIAENHIDYWIYGHSHTNIDTVIEKTKIVSNQLGYIAHNEQHNGFNSNRNINLNKE